jgi:hypothetical protein
MKRVAAAVFVLASVISLAVPSLAAAGDESANAGGSVGPECTKDPNSYMCLIEKDREAENFEKEQRVSSDVKDLEEILSRFEFLTHAWGCASTGFGVYATPGDADVMNFVFTLLGQTLVRNGQQFGGDIVTNHLVARGKQENRSCDGIEIGTVEHYTAPVEALFQLKDMIATWLAKNEVESSEILSFYIPQVREMYGRFCAARLLAHREKDVVVPEEVPLAILPIVETDDSTEARCHVGGQLHTMYANEAPEKSIRIRRQISSMLDACYASGRVSSKPAEFGEVLLAANREAEARELFDLAVQRGSLCHAHQRPEMFHRKDLSANPIWGLDSFPPVLVRKIIAVQDDLAASLASPDFVFSNDTETMSSFLESGEWERTILYASNSWQEFNCRQLGEKLCLKMRSLVTEVVESNDGYSFGCNGSLVLDVWRIQPNSTSSRATGASNIVLQMLMPLRANGNTLLANVGEEAIKIDEGDLVIVDDSFENTLKVQKEEPLVDGPMIIFHMQMCHPEMHEKAMDIPSKRCRR